MLLFENIKNFFTQNKLLSTVFIVLLSSCLAGSIFGMNYVECQVHAYNQSLDEQKTVVLTGDIGTADSILAHFEPLLASASYDTVLNGPDESEITVKALLYLSDSIDETFAYYGRDITEQEFSNGEPVILLNRTDYDVEMIGQTITLNAVEYAVVGLAGDNIIPYRSLSDTDGLSLLFINIPDDDRLTQLEELVYREYPNCRVKLPSKDGVSGFLDFAPSLLPTVVLLLLGLLNLNYIYVYFLKLRQNTYKVYAICGASPIKIAWLGFLEISVYAAIGSVIALAVYKGLVPFVLRGHSLFMADYIGLGYFVGLYVFVMALFSIVFLPSIASSAQKALRDASFSEE